MSKAQRLLWNLTAMITSGLCAGVVSMSANLGPGEFCRGSAHQTLQRPNAGPAKLTVGG